MSYSLLSPADWAIEPWALRIHPKQGQGRCWGVGGGASGPQSSPEAPSTTTIRTKADDRNHTRQSRGRVQCDRGKRELLRTETAGQFSPRRLRARTGRPRAPTSLFSARSLRAAAGAEPDPPVLRPSGPAHPHRVPSPGPLSATLSASPAPAPPPPPGPRSSGPCRLLARRSPRGGKGPAAPGAPAGEGRSQNPSVCAVTVRREGARVPPPRVAAARLQPSLRPVPPPPPRPPVAWQWAPAAAASAAGRKVGM